MTNTAPTPGLPIPNGMSAFRKTMSIFDGLFLAGLLLLLSVFSLPRSGQSDSLMAAYIFIMGGLVYLLAAIPYLVASIIYLVLWFRKIEGKGYSANVIPTILRVTGPLGAAAFSAWAVYMILRR